MLGGGGVIIGKDEAMLVTPGDPPIYRLGSPHNGLYTGFDREIFSPD